MGAARAALLALLVVAASAADAAPRGRPLEVLATTTILADIARCVGGPRVHARSLIGPGIDAHVYQPTPADVRTVASADVVIVNGLGLEGWVDALVRESGFGGAVAVASAGVRPLGWDGDASGATPDPHAWQDVANGMAYARAIRDALTAADPAGAADYAALTDLYLAQLRALDAWVRQQVATLPERSRLLVTSHDAMRYFGAAYGVEVRAVEGVVTGHEPDPTHVARLVALLRERGVRAVFIENVASPRVLERIGGDGGARLGGTLYSDCLGPVDGAAGTYIGMIAANTRTIVAGLAPAP